MKIDTTHTYFHAAHGYYSPCCMLYGKKLMPYLSLSTHGNVRQFQISSRFCRQGALPYTHHCSMVTVEGNVPYCSYRESDVLLHSPKGNNYHTHTIVAWSQ